MINHLYVARDMFMSFVVSLVLVFIRFFVLKDVGNILNVDDTKKVKAKNCLHKVLYYTATSVYGYCTLTKDTTFKDFYSYYAVMPSIPRFSISFYYSIEFAYYFTELQFLSADSTRKDHYELIFHHFITLLLIVLSYLKGHTNVGAVVMALHDISDPILESAKLFLYMKKQKLANISFMAFVICFTISRLVVFPLIVIYPEIKHLMLELFTSDGIVCVLLLICLYVLHVYWSVMIYRTFKKIFIQKKLQDARSNSESSST